MYEEPSVNPCKSEAAIIIVAELLETVPVSVTPLRTIVTVRPFSTPEVVTVTVPSVLSSVEFNTAPQENASVVIADIEGAAVSITNVVSCKLVVLPAVSVTVTVGV